jgi:hypothetical protein
MRQDDYVTPKLSQHEPHIKKTRVTEIYDPEIARNSPWYRAYVLSDQYGRGRRKIKKFRSRFRMPLHCVRNLITRVRDENWFPRYENVNALGQIGVPLDLLILGSLRYLGRGWTFDCLEEVTGISQEAHRVISYKYFMSLNII